eukprot:12746018-Alexandrium_andersonii.AAC.1
MLPYEGNRARHPWPTGPSAQWPAMVRKPARSNSRKEGMRMLPPLAHWPDQLGNAATQTKQASVTLRTRMHGCAPVRACV